MDFSFFDLGEIFAFLPLLGLLKGISPDISPSLLKALDEMGHGDEILIADAHFPAYRYSKNVIRADGLTADRLLKGIAPLIELDNMTTPVAMMEASAGDRLDPAVEARYRKALNYTGKIVFEERQAFYERASRAFAVVLSGETAPYGNVIIRKGVTPVAKEGAEK